MKRKVALMICLSAAIRTRLVTFLVRPITVSCLVARCLSGNPWCSWLDSSTPLARGTSQSVGWPTDEWRLILGGRRLYSFGRLLEGGSW